jgi:probable phosphoglycerate mutase
MPGVHLTDEGRAQAEAVAESLAPVKLSAVYASPIERTMETAQPIAERQNLKVEARRGLVELEFGKWSDKTFKTLRRTKLWPVIQQWPSGARFPEGESMLEVQQRGVREIEALRDKHPKDKICCVSHADVIKLIVAHYLGVHIDLFQRIEISPASVTIISVGSPWPRVVSVNASASVLGAGS